MAARKRGIYSRRQTNKGANAAERRRRRTVRDHLPFVAIDGEGAGQDAHGRQYYLLLQAGDRALCTGQPLSTVECLEFLLDLPSDAIYVGFATGYDITMILRDLPGESPGKDRSGEPILSRRARLLAKKTNKNFNNYTYWKGYGINYLPRNFFRVCRLRTLPGGKQEVIPDSSRTIYETFGFFQKSFLNTVKDYQIGTPSEHALLAEGKGNRGEFLYIPGEGVSKEVREYCALECDYLARLMTDFRDLCLAAGIRPATWNGAAKLSRYLHQKHNTITRAELEALTAPYPGLLRMAQEAYYGGRFEVTRIGWVRGDPASAPEGSNRAPVWEYDLRSAYPDAMRRLPCLAHGTWRKVTPSELRGLLDDPEALFVAPVKFRHRHPAEVLGKGAKANLCGLPVRKSSGLFWPVSGSGVYWSVELRAALKLHCEVERFGSGWVYSTACDCKPFDWVEAIYRRRQEIGKDKAGYPLKLALNALYGLLAQRVGAGKYRNFIWAGLITALTRAALIEAAAPDQTAIAMLATDAIISTRPLPHLDVTSERLGTWEAKEHEALFIVQPGLYWGPRPVVSQTRSSHGMIDAKRLFKTRGAAPKFFEKPFREGDPIPTDVFEADWARFCEEAQAATRPAGDWGPPSTKLWLRTFTGLRLAQARGTPLTAGCWVDDTREVSFDWKNKREPRARLTWEAPDCLWTQPDIGGLKSTPYDPHAKELEEMDFRLDLLAEEQPDKLDLSQPWRDAYEA